MFDELIYKYHMLSTLPGSANLLQNNLKKLTDEVAKKPLNLKDTQRALNGVTAVDGDKFREAIAYLVTENRDLEYIALLGNFLGGWIGSEKHRVDYNNKMFHYETPHMHLKASIRFSVPPGLSYNIGFVQLCTSMTNFSEYMDDGLCTVWEHQQGFPISDSYSVQNMPWYYVGTAGTNTYPSAIRGVYFSGDHTYEMDDCLTQKTRLVLFYTKSGQSKQTLLKKVRRKQAFTSCLAVQRQNENRYFIVAELCYEFDITYHLKYQNNKCNVTSQTNHSTPTFRSIAAHVKLPSQATNNMTMNDTCKEHIYRNNSRLCDSNGPISLNS
ncbi:MAG: hypothetical protein GY749_36165 [Desulfobacteraceae bacterium]|nr:hypothetical protein [Desulfobacteraceae bacterium]